MLFRSGDLPPRVRLVCELAIGIVGGLVAPAPGRIGVLVTCVFVVGLVNAVNLLDGLDGLAGGVVCASAVGFALVGGPGRVPAIALAASLGGFLWFNRPPARIYLGDAGYETSDPDVPGRRHRMVMARGDWQYLNDGVVPW